MNCAQMFGLPISRIPRHCLGILSKLFLASVQNISSDPTLTAKNARQIRRLLHPNAMEHVPDQKSIKKQKHIRNEHVQHLFCWPEQSWDLARTNLMLLPHKMQHKFIGGRKYKQHRNQFTLPYQTTSQPSQPTSPVIGAGSSGVTPCGPISNLNPLWRSGYDGSWGSGIGTPRTPLPTVSTLSPQRITGI